MNQQIHKYQKSSDKERDSILEADGNFVIHFANDEIETEIERVLLEIKDVCISRVRN